MIGTTWEVRGSWKQVMMGDGHLLEGQGEVQREGEVEDRREERVGMESDWALWNGK